MDGSALRGDRGLTAFFDPFLDLAEAGIVTDRQGVLAGDLHSVVLGRVVRGRDLHGGVEAVVRSGEIDHRSAAQADVVDICAGIRDALQEVVVDLVRRDAAVAAHEDLVRLQE